MKPQLILRDFFWLMLVCALTVGWWLAKQDRDRYLHDSEMYHSLRVILTKQPHSGIELEDRTLWIEVGGGSQSGYRLPDDFELRETYAPISGSGVTQFLKDDR
jgi:hypothetical protein